MKFKFREIEDAFLFSSTGSYGDHTAVVDKNAGKIYCQSEYGDMDEIPDEVWDSDDTFEMPHKNDLDLGSRLVFRFIQEVAPESYDRVRRIFSHRGAYAHYKDWLADNELLERWYEYEGKATEMALREWCADSGIELED